MTMYPQINFDVATQTFTLANIVGSVPLTKTYNVAAVQSGSATTTYANFVLLQYDTTDTTYQTVEVYDSQGGDAGTFAGFCCSDDVDYATMSTDGGQGLPVAYANPTGTLIPYDAFTGFNSGTTDIDALITAGRAVKVPYWNGSETITMVQFNQNIPANLAALS